MVWFVLVWLVACSGIWTLRPSRSAAIAACEQAGEPEKALALFLGLREAGGEVTPPLYNSAVAAAASRKGANRGSVSERGRDRVP